jgi:hypothetical protein
MLCFLLGIAYAMILYYRESKSEFSKSLKWIMAVFRGLTIAVIAFLLLNPMVRTTTHHSEKPIIIFAQDNSLSVITGTDSNFYRSEYPQTMNSMLDRISSSFAVDKYTFGESLNKDFQIDYSDKLTDISALFRDINSKYAGQNVGALILATDGIYNRGLNPLYSTDKFHFPIYTIALGDTNIRKDIILYKVNFNSIAYLNNDFPVEVLVSAYKCHDATTELTISSRDSVLFRRMINIGSDTYFETLNLHLKANVPGLQRYTVRLTGVDNEVSQTNNYQDFFIDVIEDRQKILVLSQSPHPDISALKQAIVTNRNYVVEEYIVDEFNKEVSGYNLIILHGLPSVSGNISNILEKIAIEHIPVLFMISQQTNLPLFNRQNTGIMVKGDQIFFNEANPEINEEFTSFNLSRSTLQAVADFPPLISPYGNSVIQPSANILFYQRIGEVTTREPLLIFNQSAESKFGIFCGTGIWKWRMFDYSKTGNHEAFNEIINKSIQYLSVKADKSFFRIFCKNSFTENENIEFNAEVYNDNYELIFIPEISITINDGQNRNYSFVFNNSGSAYSLNAGKLPVDHYSYSARVQVGEKIFTDRGEFTVTPLTIESVNTVANHNLLYNLAINSGGQMIYPHQILALYDTIIGSDYIKTITYSSKSYSEILNFPAILLLIIIFLMAEWFMRKRAGAY